MARVLQTGFEFPGTGPTVGTGTGIPASWVPAAILPSLGLPITATGTSVAVLKQGTSTTSTYPISHKSLTGIGGSCYAYIAGSNGSGITASMTNGISEGTIGFAYRPFSSATDGLIFYALTSSGQVIFTLRYANSKFYLSTGSGLLSGSLLSQDNAVNLVGSYTGAVDTSVWSWITIEFRIHPTAGYIRVYVNSLAGSSTPVINVSTWAPGATIGAYKMLSTSYTIYSGAAYCIDDLSVNSKSISFVSSTGTLSSGNTITGAGSGATASVTYVENLDSTYGGSGAGRVTVSRITGTFSDGETISNGSGWSATIRFAGGNFEGLDYNSGRMGETYLVGLSLSADRSVEMTGSDGNAVNNYLLLNEQLADDTTFTQALGVSTALDLYELEDITQDVSIISAISINSRIKKAGDVNYAIPTIDIAGQKAYYVPADITTALSYRKQHSVIDVNGLSNEPLSKQNVNDLAVGLRFK
jgi:hypothetical protein